MKSPDEVEDCNLINVVDFAVAERLNNCCSKKEINVVTFEELDDEDREAVNTSWSGEKQPVRNDKNSKSLDLLNRSREELGGCIREIQEGY